MPHPMFARAYTRELEALWSGLARVSARFPRLEHVLQRDADPRMQRLVQGAAYLFAQVREKLGDELPEVGDALVTRALPGVLRGLPSATVVELGASAAARRVAVVPAGSTLLVRKGRDTLRFTSAWDCTVHPLRVAGTSVVRDATGAQRFEIAVRGAGTLEATVPGELTLFFGHPDRKLSLAIARALALAPEVRLRASRRGRLPVETTVRAAIRVRGLDAADRVYPGRSERFRSSTLLRELAVFPEKHAFVTLQLPPRFREEIGEHETLALEVDLPFAVAGAELLDATHVRTCCVPMVNVFGADTGVLRGVRAPTLPLRSAEVPHAEPYEVERVVLDPGVPAETVVPSWEHDFVDGTGTILHRVLRRRASHGEGAEWSVAFLGERSFQEPVPLRPVRVEFLASDGARTSGLGIGDVTGTVGGVTAVNVTRVTQAVLPASDREIAWRSSAHARMAAGTLADLGHLRAFLEVNDPLRLVSPETLQASAHERVHRLDADGDLQWGDHYRIDLDGESLGGVGAVHVLAHALHAALAERTELSRFVTLDVHDGDQTVRRPACTGERAPFPFG